MLSPSPTDTILLLPMHPFNVYQPLVVLVKKEHIHVFRPPGHAEEMSHERKPTYASYQYRSVRDSGSKKIIFHLFLSFEENVARRMSRRRPCSHSRVRQHICEDRSTFCRSSLSPNRCLLDVGVGQSNARLLPPSLPFPTKKIPDTHQEL